MERDRDRKGQGGMVAGMYSFQFEEDVQALGERKTEAFLSLTLVFYVFCKKSFSLPARLPFF